MVGNYLYMENQTSTKVSLFRSGAPFVNVKVLRLVNSSNHSTDERRKWKN